MTDPMFDYYSLSEVAARLDIHPFDLSRYLALQKGGIPNELRFSSTQIDQMALGLGLQSWWSESFILEDGNRSRLLIRELARRLYNADIEQGTRADNLYRGLEGNDYNFVRRVVNAFIKCKILRSFATLTGVSVTLGTLDDLDSVLQQIQSGENFPAEIMALLS